MGSLRVLPGLRACYNLREYPMRDSITNAIPKLASTIEQQTSDLDMHGYCFVANALSSGEVAARSALSQACPRVGRPRLGKRVRSLELYRQHRQTWRHPRAPHRPVVDALAGDSRATLRPGGFDDAGGGTRSQHRSGSATRNNFARRGIERRLDADRLHSGEWCNFGRARESSFRATAGARARQKRPLGVLRGAGRHSGSCSTGAPGTPRAGMSAAGTVSRP